MPKLTLDDLALRGKRVLVRVDFNVPLERDDSGRRTVSDDTRIRAALPTIKAITQAGGKAILASHLGRPKGTPDPQLSLSPVGEHLETLIGQRVRFVSNTTGEVVQKTIRNMPEGSILLLENTRFCSEERNNNADFAARLAQLADVYVNDAFGTAHRAHASTQGVAHLVGQAAMGYLLQREITYLSQVLETPEPPAIWGVRKANRTRN